MENKKKQVGFRLTEEEYQHLKEKVRKTGLTMGEFVCKAVDGAVIHEAPPIVYYAFMIELTRISTGLTELIKQSRSKQPADTQLLFDVLHEVEKAKMILWNTYGPAIQEEMNHVQ